MMDRNFLLSSFFAATTVRWTTTCTEKVIKNADETLHNENPRVTYRSRL